ncbi:hypothetical protein PILCRDRAFT_816540 [Piloderma croceum F 1598]|uniref:Uncharacterized protein n=1 Tax=Piloderma croceum (strain F 1598) TaxID=765440 RepID=A0A0C3C8F6_PILCF|nr:hypothetical protein PILCRDRAFT_816540 [Piloderma croceum F 1598]
MLVYFGIFIIFNRNRVPRFVFGRAVLGASHLNQYLLDGLPVVFSGLRWPLVTAIKFFIDLIAV